MNDNLSAKTLFRVAWCWLLLALVGCTLPSSTDHPPSRTIAIRPEAVKIDPRIDTFPPVLHLSDWDDPKPVFGPINTPGVEDSPFITPDGQQLFFFFTPDAQVPPEQQLTDQVTGIWWAKRNEKRWSNPERILLSEAEALDGAPFVNADTMWFASARPGNLGEIDIYTAQLVDGRWVQAQNAGEQLNRLYDVGELHLAPDGQTLYVGGRQKWDDFAGKDIFVLERNETGWGEPVPLPAPINTPELNEDQPFISSDGRELWFTGESRLGYTGPAIFRSLRSADGGWGEPVEVVSNFAAEPSLDEQGNLYFAHHFMNTSVVIIEADIYVAYRE